MTREVSRILLIRRDNIGDLVLTTPLLDALRQRFPRAQLDVLTNSYCAPVLAGNPVVNEVFVYEKAHHRGERSVFGVYWDRLCLIWKLRRTGYDCIILGKPQTEPRPLQLARMVGAPMVVGVTEPGSPYERHLTHPLYWREEVGLHLAERCMQLMEPFGPRPTAGPLRLFPDAGLLAAAQARVHAALGAGAAPLAVQISARKIRQRWPVARYAELMQRLHREHGLRFALFWSPGSADNPMHPGDDEKAAELLGLLGPAFPCVPMTTQTLPELFAGLAAMAGMITSDGGALHMGAAVGLPTLAFFGNSEAARWRPWGVPFQVLQKPSQDVGDISVDEALAAFESLLPALRGQA